MISKIKSESDNDIHSFWDNSYSSSLSKQDLLIAYNDFVKLKNAGYNDDSAFEYDKLWKISPNNKVFLAGLYSPKQITPKQAEINKNKYYKILLT